MAACAARLGAETTFLGKVGRDAFGEEFLRLLAALSVTKIGVVNVLPTRAEADRLWAQTR
jgi:sugar/nucleoside kinase (ribokinase family)